MHPMFQLLRIIQLWEVIISFTLYMKMMRAFQMKANRGGRISAIKCKHVLMQAHACLRTLDEPLRMSTPVWWIPGYRCTDLILQMKNLPLTPHRDHRSSNNTQPRWGERSKSFSVLDVAEILILNSSSQPSTQIRTDNDEFIMSLVASSAQYLHTSAASLVS